jgi:hypothetical protein
MSTDIQVPSVVVKLISGSCRAAWVTSHCGAAFAVRSLRRCSLQQHHQDEHVRSLGGGNSNLKSADCRFQIEKG